MLWCFFPTVHPRERLSFKPRVSHSLSWEVLSMQSEFLWSVFDRSAMLAIISHCNSPVFFLLFISKQSAVAAAGNMKRITCCAVEYFSRNRPAWHWVFTTTNLKAFMNWLQFDVLLCCTVGDRELKSIYLSGNVTDYKRFCKNYPSHKFQSPFFSIEPSSVKVRVNVFCGSVLVTKLSRLFTVWGVIVLTWEAITRHCKCATPLPVPPHSHGLVVSLLSYQLSNIPGVFMLSKNSTFSVRWTSRASTGL